MSNIIDLQDPALLSMARYKRLKQPILIVIDNVYRETMFTLDAKAVSNLNITRDNIAFEASIGGVLKKFNFSKSDVVYMGEYI